MELISRGNFVDSVPLSKWVNRVSSHNGPGSCRAGWIGQTHLTTLNPFLLVALINIIWANFTKCTPNSVGQIFFHSFVMQNAIKNHLGWLSLFGLMGQEGSDPIRFDQDRIKFPIKLNKSYLNGPLLVFKIKMVQVHSYSFFNTKYDFISIPIAYKSIRYK